MATTTAVLKARVERGAALLDAKQPGWAPRIDVDALSMTSGNKCVLGQLHPHTTVASGYMVGKQALGLAFPATDIPYGFSTTDHRHDARLLPLWREAIEARRGGDA